MAIANLDEITGKLPPAPGIPQHAAAGNQLIAVWGVTFSTRADAVQIYKYLHYSGTAACSRNDSFQYLASLGAISLY